MDKAGLLPSESDMLAAIRSRDVTFNERFVFGVITTGIYCLPSCPSRRAKPENMRFFLNNAAAVLAGFRACKRCSPDNLDAHFHKLVQVARHIEKHADEKLTLRQLAERFGLSASRFHHLFKQTFGVSPKAYQDQYRLRQFKSSLKKGDAVTDAIFSAGYGSTSRVYGNAMKNIGMTPSAYRNGGIDEEISYASRETALGTLMIAATNRGVCFAQFGESSQALSKQLREEFPHANITPSKSTHSSELNEWMRAIDEYIGADAPRPDLPLDLRGTAFQIKVWQFLLASSEGQVFSYTDVAQGIDKPTAVRAAASACGANRVAILVPCHRVLRANGDIGAYRWGAARKRALLDLERKRKSRLS